MTELGRVVRTALAVFKRLNSGEAVPLKKEDDMQKKYYHEMDRRERRDHMLEYGQKYGMSQQPLLDLDERYRSVGIFEPDCISAEVSPGWIGLFENCVKVLSEHGCTLGQVKQKFGVLTVHWDPPAWARDAIRGWYDSGKVGPDPGSLFWEVRQVIDLMAHRSKFTCELCGQQAREGAGHPISGTRLCNKCREEKNAQRKT